MARLVNEKDMELIYEKCRQVYLKQLTESKACAELNGKTPASQSSLHMYIKIYECMRKGDCYKMGTSAAFTKYLAEKIYEEIGEKGLCIALAAARQNAEYRISVGNEQPGITAVCKELIAKYDLPTDYDGLRKYDHTGPIYAAAFLSRPADFVIGRAESTVPLKIQISYGAISFEASGKLEEVQEQLNRFESDILPMTKSAVDQLVTGRNAETKEEGLVHVDPPISTGKALLDSMPSLTMLKEKKDFKARMIPLMYLAATKHSRTDLSISDIQELMRDAISETATKSQIEDVFSRRAHWFERVSQNPRRYKLIDIGIEYAKNILSELES